MKINITVVARYSDAEVSKVNNEIRALNLVNKSLVAGKKSLPFKIFISQDSPDCFYLGNQLVRYKKALAVPVCCKISDYYRYLDSALIVGRDYDGICYTTSEIFKTATNFVDASREYQYEIIKVTSNSMMLAADLTGTSFNSIITNIASKIGLQNMKEAIKGLSGLKFSDSRTYLNRKEFYVNKYGTYVY